MLATYCKRHALLHLHIFHRHRERARLKSFSKDVWVECCVQFVPFGIPWLSSSTRSASRGIAAIVAWQNHDSKREIILEKATKSKATRNTFIERSCWPKSYLFPAGGLFERALFLVPFRRFFFLLGELSLEGLLMDDVWLG